MTEQPPNDEPQNLIEVAADVGMQTAAEMIEDAGGTVKVIFMNIVADGIEPNSVSAGTGDFSDDPDERAHEIVVWLLTEAAQTAKAIGLNVHLVFASVVGADK